MRVLDKLGLTDAQKAARANSIGGSDANIIASGDAARIERLRLEKLGRAEPEDLSRVLPVVMGQMSEPLNLDWLEFNTGMIVTREGESVTVPECPWMTATLDGWTPHESNTGGIVVECKHVSAFAKEDEVVQRYMPQLMHNMRVVGASAAYLSVFFGTLKWDVWRIEYNADYDAKLIELEMLFHDCMVNDKPWPGAEPPAPPPVPGKLREIDMSSSNSWASAAGDWLLNKEAAASFNSAAKQLKDLTEGDVGRAYGHGVEVNRDKRGSLRIKEMKA